MPIAYKSSINKDVSYIVWEITETEDELLRHLNLNDEEKADLASVKIAPKRLEWLGARTALKFLVKEIGQFYIYKDQFGKPHLKDTPIGISVSHAKGFGAAAINLQITNAQNLAAIHLLHSVLRWRPLLRRLQKGRPGRCSDISGWYRNWPGR